MSADVFHRRLNGVAIYNPDLLSKDELVEQFIARQDLLAHFVADLHRPAFRQHQVIVGTQGMGKTTLLRRLRYAVEDDLKLDAVWIPVTFPEEQYNVVHLSDLYLNFIDALDDALEHRGRRGEAEALDEAREGLPRGDESRRAEAALELLLDTAKRLDRRLLLLVDNLDLVLERLAKQPSEQWAFREMLSQKHVILLIGAMPVVIGATYDHDAPFYDFFQIHELGGLTRDETRRVLKRMAEHQGAPAVQSVLETDPARIDTLHTLTAGNPRTIALLFSVLAQGADGDVRTDLERLLDQCTPLYKPRFEALPAQAQHVVDAIAIHWDPISAGELAEKLSVDVNTVSAQLSRLVQQGVLEKVEYDPATKIGFQVAERFFNIWYLMRASRRVRRRLIWLTHFLRVFYGAAELRAKIDSVLRSASINSPSEKLRHAEICLALAEIVDQGDRKMRSTLEATAIRALVSDNELSRQVVAILDLNGADASLRPVVDRERWTYQFDTAMDALSADDTTKMQIRELVGGAPLLSRESRLVIVRDWPNMTRADRKKMLAPLREIHQDMVAVYGSRVALLIGQAVRDGYMDTLDDEEGAMSASVALDAPVLEALFATKRADGTEHLRRLLHASNDPFIKLTLAANLLRENENTEALTLIEDARRQEGFAYADFTYSEALTRLGRSDDAITALSASLEHMPKYVDGWRKLAALLFSLERVTEAIDAYRKALAIKRDSAILAEAGRALLLVNRDQEAVTLLREARSGDTKVSTTLYLAIGLVRMEQSAEARELAESVRQRADLLDEEALVCTWLLFALGEDVLAMQLALPVLPRAFQSGAWLLPLLLPVLRLTAKHGHGSTVAGLMEKLNLNKTMQPLYVALRISGGDSRERLKRLSPEAREAAEALLKEWSVAPVSKTAGKKPPARRKRSS